MIGAEKSRALDDCLKRKDQPIPWPVEAPIEGKRIALWIKRAIDIVGSFFLLILVAPFFPLIALAIRIDSPGPIFFKPRIIGRHGREFFAYKFRTMREHAFEELLNNQALLQEYKKSLKIVGDPRITRLGRCLRVTSIDELPQLVNVLRGEMSLVGPRMLADLELQKFGESRETIISVRPGMAGLWVASGRQNLSFQRRMELELFYVTHWSLWLDAKCLFKTLVIALRMIGAH
jgi:lipopolysaccharide/colanic/teichoic acid biosynthesis glycosyltransferase